MFFAKVSDRLSECDCFDLLRDIVFTEFPCMLFWYIEIVLIDCLAEASPVWRGQSRRYNEESTYAV